MKKRINSILAVCGLFLLLSGAARAEMIRELVTVQNAVPVNLEGIGIVTGLSNTGDKSKAALILLREYLNNRNFSFDESALAPGSVALVRVTAELRPFSRPGQKLDVTVTTLSDAKSLVGGQLMSCDLFVNAENSDPMAIATGQVIVGENMLNRGTILAGQNSGGLQIGVHPFGDFINREGMLRLNLNTPSWNDAETIARQINQTPSLNPFLQETTMFAEAEPSRPVAFAKDAGQVLVRVPPQYLTEVSRYIGNILDVPVSINRPATILVNRAKNAIVVTGDIRVNNAMVSLQDKTVTVRPETPEAPAAYMLENETPRNLVELEGPGTYADLQGLIDTLNAMGLTTDQVITVFEQLRSAGAIRADFINQ